MVTNIVIRGGERYGGNSLKDLQRTVRHSSTLEMDFLLSNDRLLAGHDPPDIGPGRRLLDLASALDALPTRTTLYLDLKSTQVPECRAAALEVALDAIESRARRTKVVMMAYAFHPEALHRATAGGIPTVLKSGEALGEDAAVAFANEAVALGCVGICVPVPPASAAAILERAPAVRLIVPVWGPFRERRQTIRALWLAGVRDFITGYGWFRVYRAAMGWRF